MRRPCARAWAVCGAIVAAASVAGGAQRRGEAPDAALERAGAYVEEYYARAQSIVGVETVSIGSVAPDLTTGGFPTRFIYDLRIQWTPSAGGPPVASVVRELVSVNGRAPRPRDEPHCLAPKALTPEPLVMFLKEHQGEFAFSVAGPGRVDRRPAVMLDYRMRSAGPPVVAWERECFSLDLPARLRGRVWVDASTGEILRIDETNSGPFEIEVPRTQQRTGVPAVVTFDRSAVSIKYKSVTFQDPDETILLPSSMDALTLTRTGGTRMTTTYSNYRRFVTGGRIVP